MFICTRFRVRVRPEPTAPRNDGVWFGGDQRMKRAGVWLVYLIGAISIGYLALFAYAALTRQDFVPGDPIQIFRKPDAPSYS